LLYKTPVSIHFFFLDSCQTEELKSELLESDVMQFTSLFNLPYRIIFAVATQDSVVLYDTQQPMPIAYLGQYHYASITDIAW
jgi:hypothetical protein